MIRLIFFIVLIFNINLLSEEDREYIDPQGREFWLCFMKNHLDPPNMTQEKILNLELFIAAETDSKVKIDIDSLFYHEEVLVKAGDVVNVKLSPLAQIISSEVVEKGLAVHVTSNNPVTVYGLNRRKKTTDTFLAYPIEALGKNYRTSNYSIAVDLLSEFAVIATEDDTEITIVPTVETSYIKPSNSSNQKSQLLLNADGHKAGEPYIVKLNKGDVYQVLAKKILLSAAKCDLTGSLISSNKKIAVFSGHQCAYVPDELLHCNHLVEQLPPIGSWGKQYYVGRQQKRSASTVRVIANEDNSKIFVNSKLKSTINSGEFLELPLVDEAQITSNNKIMVVQYSHGSMRDSIGDPMMMMISPVKQYLKKYSFATPVNGYWEHFVNVICPTEAISTLRLDGEPVPLEKWSKFQNTRYSIAYLKVDYGNHTIIADKAFGMSTYGFGYNEDQFDAYGNSGGQSFLKISFSDSLAPTAELSPTQKTEVIIRDDRSDDSGLKSVKVLSKNNFKYGAPLLEESAPQISIFPDPENPSLNADLTLELIDMRGNISYYTLCYRFDKASSRMIFDLNEGKDACLELKGFDIGVSYSFGDYSLTVGNGVSSDFIQDGKLNDASIDLSHITFSGLYHYNNKIKFGLDLSIQSINGSLSGPDSSISQTRDLVTGELRPYQEAGILNLDINMLSFDFYGRYDFWKGIYLKSGPNFIINTNKDVNYQKEIVTPQYLQFPNGEIRESIYSGSSSDISSLDLFFGTGLGYQKNITDRFYVYGEYNYYFGLTNLIADDFVSQDRYFATIGLRYRF